MKEIKGTLMKIEELRDELHNLIDKKVMLKDEEIIRISKQLDILLNEYYVLLQKKVGKG